MYYLEWTLTGGPRRRVQGSASAIADLEATLADTEGITDIEAGPVSHAAHIELPADSQLAAQVCGSMWEEDLR